MIWEENLITQLNNSIPIWCGHLVQLMEHTQGKCMGCLYVCARYSSGTKKCRFTRYNNGISVTHQVKTELNRTKSELLISASGWDRVYWVKNKTIPSDILMRFSNMSHQSQTSIRQACSNQLLSKHFFAQATYMAHDSFTETRHFQLVIIVLIKSVSWFGVHVSPVPREIPAHWITREAGSPNMSLCSTYPAE